MILHFYEIRYNYEIFSVFLLVFGAELLAAFRLRDKAIELGRPERRPGTVSVNLSVYARQMMV